MTGERGTWRGAEWEGTGRMKLERDRTGRRYTKALREWRESCAFSELSLAASVVSLLRSGTTGVVAKNCFEYTTKTIPGVVTGYFPFDFMLYSSVHPFKIYK